MFSVQATHLEQTLGTYTAFGMASRWLVIPTEWDFAIAGIYVKNVTMDNVVVAETYKHQVFENVLILKQGCFPGIIIT